MKQPPNPGNNQPIGLPPDDVHERIAKRAYYIWLANGGGQGEPLRYWLQAESEELKAIQHGQAEPSAVRRARQIGKPRSAPVSHDAVLTQ